MNPDFDILIAGAGPAGCAAAYDLAHAGLRVLLLDKRTFPRHKACACGLTRKTLAALRYSVAPVTERLCHEIILQPTIPTTDPGAPGPDSEMWEDNPGAPGPDFGTWVSTNLPTPDRSRDVRVRTRTPICAMAVRSRFDAFCLAQTLASGRNGGAVTLRKIESILALRETDDHIELDITTTAGTETLRAPVLIGADGSNGQTRRLSTTLPSALKGTGFSPSVTAKDAEGALAPEGTAADPPWYTRGFALEATVPFSSLPRKRSPSAQNPHDLIFDFAPIPGGYGWLFPKADHINIGVGTFAPEPTPTPGAPDTTTAGAPGPDSRTRASTNLKAITRQLLLDYTHQKLGLLPAALDQLHITGQHLGMGGHAYIPRGRVLLVGDAAGLVDPLTGEGIHSAIVSAQAAAAAILETLSNKSPSIGSALKGTGFSPSIGSHPKKSALAAEGVAAAYAKHLAPLQQTLAFSHRAARAFYRQPERGFRAMRIPFLRHLILKTYADGLPHTRLLTALAKLI